MTNPKIKLENVTKTYQLYNKQSEKILDMFVSRKKRNNRTFNALNGVSFEIQEGETIGIIGINGSGKSTLSNILSQIVPPTTGVVEINGETSLLAINAGLDRQLTGMENIKLKCLMLGFKKQQINDMIPEILEFADIGNFIDQPVKSYSSGMKSRLGFAISAYTNPDILIIDEALSVGDKTFYQKCIDKIEEFKATGKTILFISHSISQIRSISDHVLWLHHGEVREFGETSDVLEKYDKFIKWYNQLTKQEQKDYRSEMLKNQSIEKVKAMSSRRSQQKREKRSGSGAFPIFFFLLLTVLAGAYLLKATPPANAQQSKTSSSSSSAAGKHMTKKATTNAVPTSVMSAKGLISSENTQLYSNKQFTKKVGSLDFASEVLVTEKVGDMGYKVSYNGNTAFVKKENLSLMKDNTTTTDITYDQLSPIFPSVFIKSYQYYFTFFGENLEQIKSSFQDTPKEEQVGGREALNYNYYQCEYVFNTSGIADTLIVLNINSNAPIISQLKANAQLTSSDGNLIYASIKGYSVLLNLKDNQATFKAISE
ncbi:teichoic acids export ABC transporter ATP-binding subunit TagH [Pullulanibacillus sp. KACC 23026]|uniref:teichoic acids export ABC transporter ATP-binding subunit TagH n=1 Tax=Pullulanibacillus sp. KACC 23026 TaxID=3028315 RepID=UPI0023AFEE12|nr:teichoic acids export ABC transporter ATP-binding subunit TagH [Pullulanibacillus sp. KACC 23026]WEG13306.1 teichoic acids export ABC transporter ATP-binding subunit TagH [Pullulanibacillus sp. KACC 23026]